MAVPSSTQLLRRKERTLGCTVRVRGIVWPLAPLLRLSITERTLGCTVPGGMVAWDGRGKARVVDTFRPLAQDRVTVPEVHLPSR
jgi:hypothetical protein